MSFKKAKNEQSAIKALLYGAQGAGKTLTALDIADGLSKKFGGRVAMIATERGYDFYTQASKTRALHPEAFDFDVDSTKSFVDAMKDADEFIRSKNHSVLIVDSLTQVYESCKDVYGDKNKIGAIKIHTWNKINEQYGLFIEKLINCDKHVIFCGRSANLYEQSESKPDEIVKTGTQPRVGKDTGHEAHTVIRMEQRMSKGQYEIYASIEKDRTSIINGQTIKWPCYKNTIEKTLVALGKTNKGIEKNTKLDLDRIEEQENQEISESSNLFVKYSGEIESAKTQSEIEKISEEIRAVIKQLTNDDIVELRRLRDSKAKEIENEKNSGSARAQKKIEESPI